jgi:hypothetical protein
MNEKLIKTLSTIVSKLPKKDLEKNLNKAKEILKNSKKEDISKILSNPELSKILGKDKDNLKNQIDEIDFENINIDEIDKKIRGD